MHFNKILQPLTFYDGFDFDFDFPESFNKFSKQFNTDIKETNTDVQFVCDLPGFNKNNITIQVKDKYLIISAKKKTEQNDTKYIRKERISESVERRFYVGDIDETTVKAKLDSGVLTINIPKQEIPEKPIKQIKID